MASNEVVIYRKFKEAIKKYGLIKDGDRILLGLSGGKDSITLLHYLKKVQNRPYKIVFEALTIKNNINNIDELYIKELCNIMNIKFHLIEIEIERKNVSCYFCSRERRKYLLEFARKYNFNKIALAHHCDDIAETIIMNQFFNAKLQSMAPKFVYDRDKLEIIRPFCFVREDEIKKYVKKNNLVGKMCNCNLNNNSIRIKAKDIIKYSSKYLDNIRENLIKSFEVLDFSE